MMSAVASLTRNCSRRFALAALAVSSLAALCAAPAEAAGDKIRRS